MPDEPFDPMGDDVYQPDPQETEQDDEGLLDPADTLDDTVDPIVDEGYSPPERLPYSQRYGVTAEDQERGETLDEQLAEEVPDVGAEDPLDDTRGDAERDDPRRTDPETGRARSGRLVEGEDDLYAEDAGLAGGAATAEEAAMHTVDDPEQPDEW